MEGTAAISGIATYGETLTATVTGAQTSAVLSYQWKASDVAISGATESTYAIKGTDIGKTITVTVTAAAGIISKVYDGTTAVEAADQTIIITKVNDGDDITVTIANATYNDAIVNTGKAITVGDLTVTGAAKDWYDVTAPSGVTGEITTKLLSSATVEVSGTYIYTGVAQTPPVANVTVKDGGTVLMHNTDYTYAATSNTNVGRATVTVSFKGNYSGTAEKTFAITPASPTLTWDNIAQAVTYTGALANITAPTVTGINSEPPSGAITYQFKKTGDGTYSNGLPTNAGAYTIVATIAANGNYAEAQSSEMTLTIYKSTPTLEIDSGYTGKDYDGTAMAAPTADQVTVTGANHGNVQFDYSTNADMSSSSDTAPN